MKLIANYKEYFFCIYSTEGCDFYFVIWIIFINNYGDYMVRYTDIIS